MAVTSSSGQVTAPTPHACTTDPTIGGRGPLNPEMGEFCHSGQHAISLPSR